MNRDVVLVRVAVLHGVFLGGLLVALRLAAQPVRGALLGGGIAALSFASFWVIARSITDARKKVLAVMLGSAKILAYFTLTALVLSGRLVADASGFALGVTCLVAAVLGGAALGVPRAQPPHQPAVGGA